MGRVWDVAALFRFAVAFAVGVAGAGGDHAGAGAFLDDVVDHVLLSISVVSAHTLVRGCPICAYCITVVGGVAIWCAICFLVLDVAPHCARSVLRWGVRCL